MSDQNKNQQFGHDQNADKNRQQGQQGNQQNQQQQQKHQPQSEHDKDMGQGKDRKQA